ncbi:unnamed protein product [Schistosoma mattheei]|uniref:Uncharacterized protein n=1 Tax=Schistosoma mattheei TaxID=31246 RepID=A0AA85AW74_9TREM|nr:unnamed protein product [Schistosoma mattheei]
MAFKKGTSLSAVVSLTDIIPELPLPAPLHAGSSVETLLHDSRISIDAFQCLRFGHDRLVGCLSEALGSVCTNNIDFKEGFASDIIDPHLLPEPLVSSLKKLPNFEQKRGFYGLSYESFNPVNSVSSAHKVQPVSWCSSLDQPLSSELHYPNSFEEPIESPSKRRKSGKRKNTSTVMMAIRVEQEANQMPLLQQPVVVQLQINLRIIHCLPLQHMVL